MNSPKRKPTTPGEILFEEFLVPLGITQKELADHIGVDYKVINRIVNEHSRISIDLAMKLALAFETTPDFWLNAQMALDLWSLKKTRKKISSLIKERQVA
jgi:addiction module HigA family antidote